MEPDVLSAADLVLFKGLIVNIMFKLQNSSMQIRGWRLAQIGCPVSGSYINAKMIKIVAKNLIFYAHQRNTHLTLLLSSQRSEASFRNSNAILGELIQEPGKK